MRPEGVGATGARLTGVGFGGCRVNLVPVDAAGDFEAGVRGRYHEGYLSAHPGVSAGEPSFVAHPSAGAGYL